jgi:organic radical activating enzyme
MKTNFYILLILLLAFSFGNAQNTPEAVEIETNKTISVSNEDEIATVNAEVKTVKENDSLLIDAATIKETIARSSSDIRVYLNHKRKVSNISLVFQGINKATRA